MAETLVAILLVTSSSKGYSLVFHWPPSPSTSPRLARPRPLNDAGYSHVDSVWLAAHNPDASLSESLKNLCSFRGDSQEDGREYEWTRPNIARARSRSFVPSRSRPGSGRNSPSHDGGIYDPGASRNPAEKEYDNLLGYSTEFLASILCPQPTLCHQKFEWIVDDLAFIGHPVCAEVDGQWKFKFKAERGRNSSNKNTHDSEPPIEEVEPAPLDSQTTSHSSSLQSFHLVLVMDLPDPSSSASGNLFKYFHVIYEHIAFMVTAILFQEQVIHGFMESECDSLGTLRESCISKGEPFSEYVSQALQSSSLARGMKIIFEAVKSNTIAPLVINNVGVELQLPPYLDTLLHTEEVDSDYIEHEDPESVSWGRELSFGWRLPPLAPWKSLLLTDMEAEKGDLVMSLRQPDLSAEDQELADGLIQFLQSASVFDSLAEMAHSLDWDLETQVYPTVRWLVYHRKAKIVDTVHEGLKTVFILPAKLDQPLAELTAEFAKDFPQPEILPLPKIFSAMSALAPTSKRQGDMHFFATVVRAKELLPLYRDVVLWLLKRDLLVTLHLHVRVAATPALKLNVQRQREAAAARRRARRGVMLDGRGEAVEMGRRGGARARAQGSGSAVGDEDDEAADDGLGGTPPSRGHGRRRRSSGKSFGSGLTGSVIEEEEDGDDPEDDESGTSEDDKLDLINDNGLVPSIIPDPAQATPLQRRWLEAMSQGKDPVLARRFEQINQYFDGKKTDDEILYRAEISRKELREILHHYEEYLLTFLHPA